MRGLIAAIALLACERSHPVRQPVPFETDETPVMTAALTWAANWRHQPKPWLVRKQTADLSLEFTLPGDVHSLREDLPYLSREAARDYLDRNAATIDLGAESAFPTNVAGNVVVGCAECGVGLSPDAYSVSRPGFNASRSQAIVYVDYWCGPPTSGKCGMGFRLLLERRGAEWVVTQQKRLWIS